MVSYTYGAWGKPLTTTGTLATTLGQDNPFRYRGYYYDVETGLYYMKSRYYDPDTCRFLNGDVLMSTGQGVIGYNMYGYCGNNPVSGADTNGTFSVKNIIEWLVKYSVEPIVDLLESTLSQSNGTFSAGIGGTFSPGIWSFNGSVMMTVDCKGNLAAQYTAVGGAGITSTFSGSLAVFQTISNAPTYKGIEGLGYQFGGSSYAGFGGGAEFNVYPQDDKTTRYGVTVLGGIGTPGKEVHTEWGETHTIRVNRNREVKLNLFTIAHNIFRRLEKW